MRWTRRPDFPEPVAELQAGRFWLREAVEAWATKNEREVQPAPAAEPAHGAQPFRRDVWITLDQAAGYYACSPRWIEERLRKHRDTDDPMPTALIAGRRKFKIEELDPWMERNGYLDRGR